MEVKIIKANTPTELSSKRKIERLRVAAYCRVSTDDEDQEYLQIRQSQEQRQIYVKNFRD